jgi:hypothetical protein
MGLGMNNPFRWVLLGWLALAPVLFASHDLSHDELVPGSAAECVLCHIGADDDLFTPELLAIELLFERSALVSVALRARDASPLRLSRIRAPPAAA